MLATAAPGASMVSPLAAWGTVPGPPPAHGTALQAPRSARPIAHGPVLTPPSCASATLQRRHPPSPAWRQTRLRGTPCPAWPSRWRGRSRPGAHAKTRARGSSAANGQRAGRGAEAPTASRDPTGMPRTEARATAACRASGHATAPRGHQALRPALGVARRARAGLPRRVSPTACGGCSAPAPEAPWTPSTRCARSWHRPGGGHRDLARSQRTHRPWSARVAQAASAPQDVCGAATDGRRRPTASTSAHTTVCGRCQEATGGTKAKNPLSGSVCLLTRCRWQTPDSRHHGSDSGPGTSVSCMIAQVCCSRSNHIRP